MKPPILLGLILGGVILAGWLVVPPLFRSPGATISDGMQKAEQARRELIGYSPLLAQFSAGANVDALKGADLADMLARAQQRFEDGLQSAAEVVQTAKALDAKRPGPSRVPAAPRADAGALKGAVDTLAARFEQNRKLLNEALKTAKEAQRAAPQDLLAPLAVGMIEQSMASGLRADARRTRNTLDAERVELLDIAAHWKRTADRAAQYADFDVSSILAGLEKDLAELREQHAAAVKTDAELMEQLKERRAAVEQVRAQLTDSRTQQVAVEQAGFQPGSESSFATYRTQISNLSARLAELQEQEHLLTWGGVRGASYADDDIASGAMSGGEPINGLTELERRVQISNERVKRLDAGVKSIEARIASVRATGEASAAEGAAFRGRLDELKTQLDAQQSRLKELAEKAFNEERDALEAGTRAASAFASGKNAVDARARAASELASEADPQGENDRLKKIKSDELLGHLPAGGEADARVLVGWIYLDRIDGVSRYKDMLERLTRMFPGSQFDAAALDEAVNTAREEGVKSLTAARDLYERIAPRSGQADWTVLGALATVNVLLAKIDPANAATYNAAAGDALSKALSGRERSPYLQHLVRLRDHLGMPSTPPAPAEGEKPAEEPAAEPAPEPADEP